MNIKDIESKLQNATSVKDLTQADVATIEGLVVMDFMTPSMLVHGHYWPAKRLLGRKKRCFAPHLTSIRPK